MEHSFHELIGTVDEGIEDKNLRSIIQDPQGKAENNIQVSRIRRPAHKLKGTGKDSTRRLSSADNDGYR
jgi:hypothetical protein